MNTWRLWTSMRYPLADHPLFKRIHALPPLHFTRTLLVSGMGCGLLLCLGVLISPALLIILLFLPVLYITFHGLIYGFAWTIQIARAIVQEQRHATYDLLALTPGGAFGMHWLIAMGCIYRGRQLQQLQVFSVEEFFIALLVAVILSIERAQVYSFQGSMIILLGFYSLVFLVIFYLNHIQSVILGCLVGMLTPLYLSGRSDTALYTGGLYLLLQSSTLLAIALVLFALLPLITNEGSLVVEMAVALIGVALFCGLREAIIVGLWRVLLRQLKADSLDLEQHRITI